MLENVSHSCNHQQDEEVEDLISWARNEKTGSDTTKLGYQVLAEANFAGEKKWWWSFVWGVNARLKLKYWLG